jgi:hypothetical protein
MSVINETTIHLSTEEIEEIIIEFLKNKNLEVSSIVFNLTTEKCGPNNSECTNLTGAGV